VTRLRNLEAAAERIAMDGRDERFGCVLDPFQQRVRPRGSRQRVLAGLQRVEHLDIRTGDERRACADEHDRPGGRISVRARDRLVDTLPHRGTQRIDRRIVDGDDRDAICDFVSNKGHDGSVAAEYTCAAAVTEGLRQIRPRRCRS
jgi:hypothetical protein